MSCRDKSDEDLLVYGSDEESGGSDIIVHGPRKRVILSDESLDENNDQISDITEDNHAKPVSEDFQDFESENWNHKSLFSSTVINDNCSKSVNIVEKSTLVLSSAANSSINDSTKILNSSDDKIVVVSDDDSDLVVINSDESNELDEKGNITLKQPTLRQFLQKSTVLEQPAPNSDEYVSKEDYDRQRDVLNKAQIEFNRLQNAMRVIDINKLPDKGASLLSKHKICLAHIQKEEEKLSNMIVKKEPLENNWSKIEQGAAAIQPKTFGKQALNTYNTERALSLACLQGLHKSLQTCPSPDILAEDPSGLNVTLMNHQKHGLAWMTWRETQKPSGGILADDMGLGKTLSMLSLICASKYQDNEEDEEDSSGSDSEREPESPKIKYNGGTLIVCPASLLGQWSSEIKDKLKKGVLSFEIYHGPNREPKAKRLSKYDVVITTYAICQSDEKSNGTIFRIKWRRIILDEAHQIRNHKSKTALAIFKFKAKSRWALTGTPVHNKEMDLFALIKFLKCSPFDDYNVFKRWISNKNSGANHRLHTVLSSMFLRRTKEELKKLNEITSLPEREWELLEVKLSKEELDVYQKILMFSKTLFAQFLHQKAEKTADTLPTYNDCDDVYFKMHKKLVKMNGITEVKQSHILVLLLRLRQLCCHPSLITAMLNNDEIDDEDYENDGDISINLLNQLDNLRIDNDLDENQEALTENEQGDGAVTVSRTLLNPNNPVFQKERLSNKLEHALILVKEKIVASGDKGIVVSQWTSLLKLLAIHLDREAIEFCQLDGTVPVSKRQEIVANFNNSKNSVQIMLLSLTAGGVGLNLVGANHLVFLDLHWNPQLEQQAQDRIYRFGQRKTVHIYKFVSMETIEERIKKLQDRKKELAESVLTGGKIQHSKLSFEDLKMLFEMK